MPRPTPSGTADETPGATVHLPGLPAEPVRRWFRRALPDLDVDTRWCPTLVSGGLSNVTYRVALGAREYIVRRPPLGRALPRAHDMEREFRVLRALWPTSVPVPEPLALCTDPDVIGATFYVMASVPGEILRTPAQTERLTPHVRTRLADAFVAALAGLHAVDPGAVGLGDYGRRGGYFVRQLRTWGEQWERSRTRDLPDMEVLRRALAELVPPDRETTVVHGDYRLDNVIVDLLPRPRIAAVLDWELSTLGDPLADLASTLTYWHDRGDDERGLVSVAAGVTALPGFPRGRELAQRYAELTGRDVDALPAYLGLAAMKLAVILEGVHARYLGGSAVGDGYERAGDAVPILVARGLRALGDAMR